MASKNIKKAVVLVSGGMDSAACLGLAKEKGCELYALTFDYGQKSRKELEMARELGKEMGVVEHKMFMLDLTSIGGSALTDDIEVPKIENKADTVPVTYVPGRNLIFLSVATAWAEKIDAEYVYIGANVRDYSGYPDCRPEFLSSFEKTAGFATRDDTNIKITAPLIEMTKSEIVKECWRLSIDLSKTSSCYEPDENGNECGLCESCRLRDKGIEEARS